MSDVYAEGEEFVYCCGVSEIGRFSLNNYWGDIARLKQVVVESTQKQTGMFVSTFTNTKACKQAYEQLCKNHILLYQSPKKRNRHTGRQVFLCVFLAKGR